MPFSQPSETVLIVARIWMLQIERVEHRRAAVAGVRDHDVVAVRRVREVAAHAIDDECEQLERIAPRAEVTGLPGGSTRPTEQVGPVRARRRARVRDCVAIDRGDIRRRNVRGIGDDAELQRGQGRRHRRIDPRSVDGRAAITARRRVDRRLRFAATADHETREPTESSHMSGCSASPAPPQGCEIERDGGTCAYPSDACAGTSPCHRTAASARYFFAGALASLGGGTSPSCVANAALFQKPHERLSLPSLLNL